MTKEDMFKYNENDVNEFVEELKKNPLLKGFSIDSSNANLYDQMARSMSKCKGCKGLLKCPNNIQGYTKKVEGNKLIMCPCKFLLKEEKEIEAENNFRAFYVPEKAKEASLENYFQTNESRKKAYKEAINFISNAEEGNNGLYLYGDYGLGKTYLLCAIANELSKKGKKCVMAYFPDLARELKNNMYNSEKLESMILELKNCDVLLLDDFGGENVTAWFRDEVLGPVLNYRFMEYKATLFSTNLKPAEILETYSHTNQGEEKLKGRRIMQRVLMLAPCAVKIEK